MSFIKSYLYPGFLLVLALQSSIVPAQNNNNSYDEVEYLKQSLDNMHAQLQHTESDAKKNETKFKRQLLKNKELANALAQKELDLVTAENNTETLQKELISMQDSIEELFLDKQQWHLAAKNHSDSLKLDNEKLQRVNNKFLNVIKKLHSHKHSLAKENKNHKIYNQQLNDQNREYAFLLQKMKSELQKHLLAGQESKLLEELEAKEKIINELEKDNRLLSADLTKLTENLSTLQAAYCKDLNEIFMHGLEEKLQLEEMLESKESPYRDDLTKYAKLCSNLIKYKDVSLENREQQQSVITSLSEKIQQLNKKIIQREDELKQKNSFLDLEQRKLIHQNRLVTQVEKDDATGKKLTNLEKKYQTLLNTLNWKNHKIKKLISTNRNLQQELSDMNEQSSVLSEDLEDLAKKYQLEKNKHQHQMIALENECAAKHELLYSQYLKQEEDLIELSKHCHIAAQEKELLTYNLENLTSEKRCNVHKFNAILSNFIKNETEFTYKITELETKLKEQQELFNHETDSQEQNHKIGCLTYLVEKQQDKLSRQNNLLCHQKGLVHLLSILLNNQEAEHKAILKEYCLALNHEVNCKNLIVSELVQTQQQLTQTQLDLHECCKDLKISDVEASLLRESLNQLHHTNYQAKNENDAFKKALYLINNNLHSSIGKQEYLQKKLHQTRLNNYNFAEKITHRFDEKCKQLTREHLIDRNDLISRLSLLSNNHIQSCKEHSDTKHCLQNNMNLQNELKQQLYDTQNLLTNANESLILQQKTFSAELLACKENNAVQIAHYGDQIKRLLYELKNIHSYLKNQNHLEEELKNAQAELALLGSDFNELKAESLIKLKKRKNKIAQLKALLTNKNFSIDGRIKDIELARQTISRLNKDKGELVSENVACDNLIKLLNTDRDLLLEINDEKNNLLKNSGIQMQAQIKTAESLKTQTRECLFKAGLLDSNQNIDGTKLLTAWANKELENLSFSDLCKKPQNNPKLSAEFSKFTRGPNFNKVMVRLLPNPDSITKIIYNPNFLKNATEHEKLEVASRRSSELASLNNAYKLLLAKKTLTQDERAFSKSPDINHLWKKLVTVSSEYFENPNLKSVSLARLSDNNELISTLSKTYL